MVGILDLDADLPRYHNHNIYNVPAVPQICICVECEAHAHDLNECLRQENEGHHEVQQVNGLIYLWHRVTVVVVVDREAHRVYQNAQSDEVGEPPVIIIWQ